MRWAGHGRLLKAWQNWHPKQRCERRKMDRQKKFRWRNCSPEMSLSSNPIAKSQRMVLLLTETAALINHPLPEKACRWTKQSLMTLSRSEEHTSELQSRGH